LVVPVAFGHGAIAIVVLVAAFAHVLIVAHVGAPVLLHARVPAVSHAGASAAVTRLSQFAAIVPIPAVALIPTIVGPLTFPASVGLPVTELAAIIRTILA